MEGVLANLKVRLGLENQLNRGLDAALGAVDNVKSKVESSASATEGAAAKTGSAWRGMALGVGLGLAGLAVGALGASAQMATGFQYTTTQIQTAAGISAGAAKQIGDAFLATSGQTIFSGKEMATAYLGVAAQLGLLEGHALNSAEALQVMRSASNLAEGTGSDLNTATAALTTTMKVFGIQVKDSANASDVLYNSSRLTGLGVGEFADGVARLHARLGVAAPSLHDTAALVIELNNAGVKGARALLQTSGAMTTLLSGSKPVNAELKALHMNVYDAHGRFIGMQATIEKLVPSLSKMSDRQRMATEQILFGKQAAGIMDAVLRKGVGGWDAAAAAAARHGSASEAAELRGKTLQGQEEKLRATLENTGTTLGLAVIPVLMKLANVVLPIVAAIANWISHNQRLAVVIIAIVGAVGAFIAIVAVVSAVVGAIVSAIAGLGVVIGVAGAAFAFILSPIGLVILAVVAVIAIVVLLITHWKQVQKVAGEVFGFIGNLFSGLGSLVKKGLGEIGSYFGSSFSAIGTTVHNILSGIGGDVGGVFSAIGTTIHNAITGVLNFIGTHWPLLLAILTGPIGIAVYMIATHWEQIKTTFSNAWHAVVGFVSNLAKDVVRFFTNLVNGVRAVVAAWWGREIAFWTSLPGRIMGAIEGLLSRAGSFFGNVGNAIRGAVMAWWGREVAFWTSVPGRIISALGNVGSLLVHAGEQIIGGLLSGITSKFEAVKNFVGGIAGKIKDLKGPEPVDRALLVPHGGWIMGGLELGLARGLDRVLAVARSVAPAIAGTVGNPALGARVTSGAGVATSGAMREISGREGRESGKKVHITNNIYNPKPEAASTSVEKRMRILAYGGAFE